MIRTLVNLSLLVAACCLITGFAGDAVCGMTVAGHINYHQRRDLRWADFEPRRQAPPGVPSKAVTFSGYTYTSTWRDGAMHFCVWGWINKSKSWRVEGAETDYLLAHEQGHFDINEINVRRLRRDISVYPFTSANLNRAMDSLTKAMQATRQREQELYDEETDHSKNKPKQERWDAHIKQALDTLKDYAATEVVRTLSDR